MIIGICGFIGAGKDTVADYLVNIHGFRRDSFAATLKDAVSSVFGWDRELLEGRTKEAREWRETVDTWWADRLSMPGLTPRYVLQVWGTEVCRRGFHDDIWIASLENKLRASHDNIVISDCRFPNEIASIKRAGGKVVWVRRGELPAWYELAVTANHGGHIAQDLLKQQGIHVSETAWVGTEFDATVYNDTTFDDLYNQIKSLVLLEPPSTKSEIYKPLADSLSILS
jgi:hypothetical protein